MKGRIQRKNQQGFTLIELMIAIAIIGAAVVTVLVYQGKAQSASKVTDTATAATAIASKIQQYYNNAPDGYTSVSPANVINMGIVTQPFRVSGTNILDAWGSTVGITGTTQSFAMTLGGAATSPLTKEECVSMATKLGPGAKVAQVGAALTITGGVVDTSKGKTYKAADGTVNTANLTDAAGCAATNPMIALQF